MVQHRGTGQHIQRDHRRWRGAHGRLRAGGIRLLSAGASRTRWRALWRALGARRGGDEAYDELISAYAEPSRAYHDVAHLRHCLAALDGARALLREPAEAEAAVWYHDAVYDPRADDNEAASAALAATRLRAGGVADDRVARIQSLILATSHAAPPAAGSDAAIVADADLSILGETPAAFDAYERAVRREYAFVPDAAYRQGRRRVLDALAGRDHVFATEYFRSRRETQARANLARSLAALGN